MREAPRTHAELVARFASTDADVVEEFVFWVFGDGDRATVRRWNSDIRVGFIGTYPRLLADIVQTQCAFFEAAMQTPVRLAVPPENTNYFVLASADFRNDLLVRYWDLVRAAFRDRSAAEGFVQTLETSGGGAWFNLVGDNTIGRALVVLPQLPQAQDVYTASWRAHFVAMGFLPRERREVANTIMSDAMEFLEPTPLDRLLLALLYDPQIRPGLGLEAVKQLLPQLVRNHRRWAGFDALAPFPAR